MDLFLLLSLADIMNLSLSPAWLEAYHLPFFAAFNKVVFLTNPIDIDCIFVQQFERFLLSSCDTERNGVLQTIKVILAHYLQTLTINVSSYIIC